MVSVPPGVPFIFRSLAAVSAPPIVVYGCSRIVHNHFALTLPTWLLIVLSILSIPLFATFKIWHKNYTIRNAAARLGATFPPTWQGKLPGNFDLLQQLLNGFRTGYPGDGLKNAYPQFGSTFCINIMWDMNYYTTDANIIKAVLATDFNNFVKGDHFSKLAHSVLGTGVFNSDGDMWKFHRSMTRPFFSRDRIGDFAVLDRHADEAITKMKERFRAGYTLDFQDLIARFTLDSASEFLFGSCVHSLHSVLPYSVNAYPPPPAAPKERSPSDAFAEAFAASQHIVSARSRTGWIWPAFEFFKNKTDEHMKVVDAFLDPIIEEALRKKEAHIADGSWSKEGEQDKAEEWETLLDHLVRYTSDKTVLHDEVLNIMIAGRDTTAATLTFAIYFLCRHPDVKDRLREEILAKVGPTQRPTTDDIKDMKYLRAVINETLRLYPAVPFNMRFAVNDTTIPNSDDPLGKPYFVPAGMPVTYSVMQMHRKKEYWGPDADNFDPDRFLDDRVAKYLTPNPFIFLPFNAGPRICLGQQFAYNEMSFFLIRLLQTFSELSLDSNPPADSRPPADWAAYPGRKGMETCRPKTHLTLYAQGGMWVNMKEAETSH